MRLIKYKIKKNNIFFKKFKINYILFKNNFKKLNTNNKKTNIFFSYFNKKNTFNIDIDNNNVKILIYFFYFNKIYLFNWWFNNNLNIFNFNIYKKNSIVNYFSHFFFNNNNNVFNFNINKITYLTDNNNNFYYNYKNKKKKNYNSILYFYKNYFYNFYIKKINNNYNKNTLLMKFNKIKLITSFNFKLKLINCFYIKKKYNFFFLNYRENFFDYFIRITNSALSLNKFFIYININKKLNNNNKIVEKNFILLNQIFTSHNKNFYKYYFYFQAKLDKNEFFFNNKNFKNLQIYNDFRINRNKSDFYFLYTHIDIKLNNNINKFFFKFNYKNFIFSSLSLFSKIVNFNFFNFFFFFNKIFFFKFFFFNKLNNILFFNKLNNILYWYVNNYFFYFKKKKNFLINNILPVNYFFNFSYKKFIFQIFSLEKFSSNITPYYYLTIIKFFEFISGKKIFFSINLNFSKYLNLNEKILCFMWSQRIKSFRKLLGPRLFLNESLQIIYLCLKNKDIFILTNWMLQMFYKISFWKYKLFFRYMHYILRYFFWSILDDIKIKGLKFQLKGKISVAGNARTRIVFFKIGTAGHSKFNNKILHDFKLIKTFTGAIGFKTWIFF